MPLNDENESTFDATPITTALIPVPSVKPARRSPLSYYTNAAKRSVRDAFSRQQLIEGVKAFLWVAPLTILICISAEPVAEDSRFAGNGVVLNGINPQLIRINVDVLDEVEAFVALPKNVTNVENAAFTPAKVKVTAPRGVLRSASGELKVYVDAA